MTDHPKPTPGKPVLFDPDNPIRLEFSEDCDGTGTWGLLWDCPMLGRKQALVKFYWPCHGPEVPEEEIDNYYRVMGHAFEEAMDKETFLSAALARAEEDVHALKLRAQHMDELAEHAEWLGILIKDHLEAPDEDTHDGLRSGLIRMNTILAKIDGGK